MSLTLVSTPVDGNNNIFAGYKPIEIEFSRQDNTITGVTQAAGNKVFITIPSVDLTGSILVGDFIYIYSEGSDFTYNYTGEVTSVTFNSPDTEVTIDREFIEIGAGGYVNYKQNYAVEMKLVNPDNDDIDLLGFDLKKTGTDAGQIIIDTNIINDDNDQDFPTTGRELEEGRIKYTFKYREVWREDDTQAFTTHTESLIAYYATKDDTLNIVSTPFDLPLFYSGYPTGGCVVHSDEGFPLGAIKITFDELDINQDDISTNNVLKEFNIGDYGALFFSSLDTNAILSQGTEYLRINVLDTTPTEYEPTQYSNEYNIV